MRVASVVTKLLGTPLLARVGGGLCSSARSFGDSSKLRLVKAGCGFVSLLWIAVAAGQAAAEPAAEEKFYVSNISFFDNKTKVPGAAVELVNQAVDAILKEIASKYPRVVLNGPQRTLANTDANAQRLSGIFWDSELTKTQKIGKIVSELLEPAQIDGVVGGLVLTENVGDDMIVTLRPFVIERSSGNMATETIKWIGREFYCIDRDQPARNVICGRARDDIREHLTRLLVPSEDVDPSERIAGGAMEDDPDCRIDGNIYVSNLSFLDAESRSVMPASDAVLIDEAVEESIKELARQEARYVINDAQRTLMNTDKNALKLNDIFWNSRMSKPEKVDEIIGELMKPTQINGLVSGQFQQQKEADGVVITVRPFVLNGQCKNFLTETKKFTLQEFSCTDPQNQNRKVICEQAREDIKDSVIRLLLNL